MKTNAASTLSSAFLCLILAVACATEDSQPDDTGEATTQEAIDPPTKEKAAEIIRSSPEFSQFRFDAPSLTLPMKEEQMDEQMREYARDLENGGWLRVDSTGIVVLGPKARRDTRWAERYTEGFTDIGPLAEKEFVGVRSIDRIDADAVSVPFTYRWNPNETGAFIRSGRLHELMTTPQYATAELRHYGEGWRLYIIRADDPPEDQPQETVDQAASPQ